MSNLDYSIARKHSLMSARIAASSPSRRIEMRLVPGLPPSGEPAFHPKCMHELSWNHAQDGKVAIDLRTGCIADVNPAMEELSGYVRAELIGAQLTMLAPEVERERVVRELSETAHRPARYVGFHLQRKDGRCVPIGISSSGAVELDGRSVTISEVRDISDHENYEKRLAAQSWALSAFSSAALALSRAHCEQELLQSICEAITKESAYVLAFVSVAAHGPEKRIRFAASSGSVVDYLDGLRLSWAEDDPDAEGPSGICIRTGQMHIVDDLESDPGFARWRERARHFGVRSVAGIPLCIEDDCRAALVVFASEPEAFEPEAVEVFQRLGEQIVHGIQALRDKMLLQAERQNLEAARRRLNDVLAATVGAMVTAMEARDPYTAGHESRVAEICVAIGKEMGWDEGRLLGMRLGAMVHDIGKIAIPAEILTRPGRLNAAEYELVKAHPETGYAILKDVPFPWPVAEMVRQHHERLDGSGYPRGLKADEILLESRVMEVADMVEAMASDRPYRRSRGLEFALRQIESEAGTRLDAEVVRICAALFREKRLVVPGLDWIETA